MSSYLSKPAITTSCPAVVCSVGGCSAPSNGIEPFNRCAAHFRALQAFRSSRDAFTSALTLRLAERSAEGLEALYANGDPTVWLDAALDEQAIARLRAGRLLDFLGHVADRTAEGLAVTNAINKEGSFA